MCVPKPELGNEFNAAIFYYEKRGEKFARLLRTSEINSPLFPQSAAHRGLGG